MDATSVARGLSISIADPAAAVSKESVLPVSSMLAPTLSVAATANPGDNVGVTAATSDADGFTTTGAQLLNGASVLGSMTGGSGSWSFTINSISAGTYTLIARRQTASGTVDSTPHVLTVGALNQPGAINVDTSTGVLRVVTSAGGDQGNVQVGT